MATPKEHDSVVEPNFKYIVAAFGGERRAAVHLLLQMWGATPRLSVLCCESSNLSAVSNIGKSTKATIRGLTSRKEEL